MLKTVTCTECTWTAENEGEERLIKAVQDHYHETHAQEITREEAIDMVHPVDEEDSLVDSDEEMSDEDLGVQKGNDEE